MRVAAVASKLRLQLVARTRNGALRASKMRGGGIQAGGGRFELNWDGAAQSFDMGPSLAQGADGRSCRALR